MLMHKEVGPDGVPILHLAGPTMLAKDAKKLMEVIAKMEDRVILIDLGDIHLHSSTGLSEIVDVLRNLLSAGKKLGFLNPTGRLRALMHLARLDGHIFADAKMATVQLLAS